MRALQIYLHSRHMLLEYKRRLDVLDWEDDDIESTFIPGIDLWMDKNARYLYIHFCAFVAAGILSFGEYEILNTDVHYFAGAIFISTSAVLFLKTYKKIRLVQDVVDEYTEMVADAEDMHNEEREC
jgi:hypothetical protein